MLSVVKRLRRKDDHEGQALVEFALSLPILLLLIAGIIDFGMILFSYSQASNSLRNALRFAEVVGYTNTGYIPYLDCDGMTDAASDNFFSASHDVDITYIKASDTTKTFTCDTVTDDDLVSGDMIRINLTAIVDPFFLPVGELDLQFEGQRSIVKAIPVAFGSGGTLPAQVSGFSAVADCSAPDDADNVDFAWNAMTNITGIRIYDDDASAVVTIDTTDTTSCIDCDKIGLDDAIRCYYAVGYNSVGEGAPSDVSCAVCVTEPPPPTNLVATPDCGTGDISFDWDWGRIDPPATGAIFYDAFTGAQVAVYDSDTPSESSCIDCLTVPLPFNNNYYMKAVQGPPGYEVLSTPSNTANVECKLATGSITVELFVDTTMNCGPYANALDAQVTISDGMGYTETVTTLTGAHTFSNLPPVTYPDALPITYSVTVQDPIGGQYLRSIYDGAVCDSTLSASVPQWSATLSAGENKIVRFGYQ